jgi:hypothetical protein
MSKLKNRFILYHHQEQSRIYFYLFISFDNMSYAVAGALLTICSLHTHTYSILQVGLHEYMFHTSLYRVILQMYQGADKSLARPTSWCILFDGENISFDASLVIYINSTNIPPVVIIIRIYKNQNLLSLLFVSFLVGLRTYQQHCICMSFGVSWLFICKKLNIKLIKWPKGFVMRDLTTG